MSKVGPTITVVTNVRCGDCTHLASKHWAIEDGNDYDWGIDYSCSHSGEPRHIGDNDNTPPWCPLIPSQPAAGTPRLCPGCRALDGEHDFGPTCTLVDGLEPATEPDTGTEETP